MTTTPDWDFFRSYLGTIEATADLHMTSAANVHAVDHLAAGLRNDLQTAGLDLHDEATIFALMAGFATCYYSVMQEARRVSDGEELEHFLTLHAVGHIRLALSLREILKMFGVARAAAS